MGILIFVVNCVYSQQTCGAFAFLHLEPGFTKHDVGHLNTLYVSEPIFVKPDVTLPWWISVQRFHLRTVLWRAGMQALVFHQNANNIICNIQSNIIVVLIGEKNC